MTKYLNSEIAKQEEVEYSSRADRQEIERLNSELEAMTELLSQYTMELAIQQKKVILLQKRLEKYEAANVGNNDG